MAWKDQLKPASLGGVPFYVESAQFDFGRSVKIERPGTGGRTSRGSTQQSESVVIKDLGSREYEIMVKAYFLGDDYTINRDRFEQVFQSEASLELILPLEDPMYVTANRGRRRWSNKDGGIEYIDASFYLAVKMPDERVTVDTPLKVDEVASSVKTGTATVFGSEFSIEDSDPFVEEAAIEKSFSFTDTLNRIKKFGTASDVFEEWVEDIDSFALDIAEVIRIPERMIADVIGLVDGIETAFTTVESAINSFGDLFDSYEFDDFIPDLSIDRQSEVKNNNMMNAGIKVSALANLTALSSKEDYPSKEEALQRLSEITDKIDQVIDAAGDNPDIAFLHVPLLNLRAAIVEDLFIRAADLPSVVTALNPAARPALTLAYDIYEDLDREEDVIARNVIRNANFSPNTLEVLAP